MPALREALQLLQRWARSPPLLLALVLPPLRVLPLLQTLPLTPPETGRRLYGQEPLVPSKWAVRAVGAGGAELWL